MIFEFRTDSEAQKFCELIVKSISELFDISSDEALARINIAWKGNEIVGEDDPIYHEDEEYWAKDICYGHDSAWWLDEDLATIKPI